MNRYRAQILTTKSNNGKVRFSVETLQKAIRTDKVINVKDAHGHPIGVVQSMKVENSIITCDFIIAPMDLKIEGKHLVPVITCTFNKLMEEIRFGYELKIHTVVVLDQPKDPGLEPIKAL